MIAPNAGAACEPRSCEGPLTFTDAAAEAVVRNDIGKPTGDIMPSDVSEYYRFNGRLGNITSLCGVECLTALTYFNMSLNFSLSDISPLATMTTLTEIDMSVCPVSDISALQNLPNISIVRIIDTQVTDLSAFVNNPGIGSGDTIYAAGLPFGTVPTLCEQVYTLRARGVTVNTGTTEQCSGGTEGVEEGQMEGAVEGQPEGEGETEGALCYTLTVNVTGNGYVAVDPDVSCQSPGTVVTLRAFPDTNWQFDHWEGNVSNTGSALTNITMNQEETVTVTFVPQGTEGDLEGVGEGQTEGEGVEEGAVEGQPEGEGAEEGAVEGQMEGEGVEEGVEEGQMEGEGVEEGAEEGQMEGEGVEEGVMEGQVEGEEDLALCPDGSLFGQPVTPFADLFNFSFSDEAASNFMYESFSGVTEAIGGVVWWGITVEGNRSTACTRDPESYNVFFYADDAGVPGSLSAQYTVTPTRTEVGMVTQGPSTGVMLYRYEAALPVPVSLESGWFSVSGVGVFTGCYFQWASSEIGDDACVVLIPDGYLTVGPDLAFCLIPVVNVEGQAEGEGQMEGEGAEEGVVEGQPEGEGVVEGAEEGVIEGAEEGAEEGVVEGAEEGVVEGAEEGVVEGQPEGEGVVEGAEEGVAEGAIEGEGETGIHNADQDGDGLISLSELLRVIQFFNSFGYHCGLDTEDGYAPGPTGLKTCSPHDSDYNPQDWEINLSELLRLIQFFNSGGYFPCLGSEDGYCPGQV